MDTKIIGNKIALARKDKNMSQAQLAQLLFISPQAVGKWERGESIPDIITFNRLAEILAVDLNHFSDSFSKADPAVGSKGIIDNTERFEEPGQEFTNGSLTQGQQLLTNFNGANLLQSDFAGVTAQKRKFHGTALRGSDFTGADLTGSWFKGSDMRETNFDKANLTDCSLFANDAANASFNETVLVRTEFNATGLAGAKFANAELTEVKLIKSDLRKTIFEHCIFNRTDFSYSDLRGQCLEGQKFVGVKFHNTALNEVSFKDATLENVSFKAPYAITNKYYRAIATICFDGAKMDKLTYAALKGLGANLSKATTV